MDTVKMSAHGAGGPGLVTGQNYTTDRVGPIAGDRALALHTERILRGLHKVVPHPTRADSRERRGGLFVQGGGSLGLCNGLFLGLAGPCNLWRCQLSRRLLGLCYFGLWCVINSGVSIDGNHGGGTRQIGETNGGGGSRVGDVVNSRRRVFCRLVGGSDVHRVHRGRDRSKARG